MAGTGEEGVATVGGRAYAVGLQWGKRTEALSVKGARTDAARRGMDLYVVNGGEQAGAGSSARGHASGMPSLALALLATCRGENVLAAHEVGDDRWYVLRVLDGAVTPTFDVVVDEGEARALVSDHADQQHWLHRQIPAHWGMGGGEGQPTLEEAVSGLAAAGGKPFKRTMLRKTSQRSLYLQVLAVIAVVGLGYAGYTAYADYETQQLIEQGRREEAERRLALERSAKQTQPILPPMPSITASRGIEALRACAGAMDAVPQYLGGWVETNLACDGASVVATMRQTDVGTINWLSLALRPVGDPQIEVRQDRTATATWRLDPSRLAAWGDVRGPSPIALARYVGSQMQEVYQPYKLGAPATPLVRTKTVGGADVTIPAPWTTTELELTQTGYLRGDVLAALDRVQNLVLTSVSEELPTRTWTIKALVFQYVPPAATPQAATNPAGTP